MTDDGRVEVSNPSSCKTNCPACARVCPHKAIIFPKYTDSPINGDEVVEGEVEDGGEGKLDEMLQGNVRDVIRNRSAKAKRFSMDPKDREGGDAKPSMEELRRGLDIPMEVLRSLTPAEIRRVSAKAKTQDTDQPQTDDDGRESKADE